MTNGHAATLRLPQTDISTASNVFSRSVNLTDSARSSRCTAGQAVLALLCRMTNDIDVNSYMALPLSLQIPLYTPHPVTGTTTGFTLQLDDEIESRVRRESKSANWLSKRIARRLKDALGPAWRQGGCSPRPADHLRLPTGAP